MGNPAVGDRMFLVVSQKPFEATGGTGTYNMFCSLLPLAFADYSRANEADFPDNGQVWWLITGDARRYAEPGRVVAARIESAVRLEPGKSRWQVDIRSVSPVREGDMLEIVRIGDASISKPRDLIATENLFTINRPPLDRLLVSWKNALYGPFRPEALASENDDTSFHVSLKPSQPGDIVYEIPRDELRKLGKDYIGERTVTVSKSEHPLSAGLATEDCNYELIAGRALPRLIAVATSQHRLLSNCAVLQAMARQLFGRKDRQQLTELLGKLRETVEGSATYNVKEEEQLILKSAADAVAREDAAVQELTAAIVQSGHLEKNIRAEIDARTKRYIEENAGRLQADVSERVQKATAALRDLEAQKQTLEDQLESDRKRASNELSKELDAARQQFERECSDQRRVLDDQKRELDRQREILRNNLGEVTKRFSEASGEVVNQFLTIAPLLPHLVGATAAPDPTVPAETEQPAAFVFPDIITKTRPEATELAELEFFTRFSSHVASAGFNHRARDLKAFHLSIKCGDLTVLSGPPGTGKSTLPGLYAEAAAGDDMDRVSKAFLPISVSPSWLDPRDLLGHVNVLERSFQPADTGLVHWLIYASREYALHGVDSGFYLACLDEMNLAQVEHYFSGILPLLDQHGRTLRLFSSESVDPRSTFAEWPAIEMAPTTRFVGTVNMDETTRPLSQRLLDRANLVQLRPPAGSAAPDISRPRCRGRAITLRDLRQWTNKATTLDKRAGTILDAMSPHLHDLGCALNPRRFRAISKFISSAPPELCTPDELLDMQIVQRLLPQVRLRGLFRHESRAAFDKLSKLLADKGEMFADSVQAMEDIRADERDFSTEAEH